MTKAPSKDELPKTAAYLEEREKLSPDLRDTFDLLVTNYRYYAFVHHLRPFVSYKVLADLVRAGWKL